MCGRPEGEGCRGNPRGHVRLPGLWQLGEQQNSSWWAWWGSPVRQGTEVRLQRAPLTGPLCCGDGVGLPPLPAASDRSLHLQQAPPCELTPRLEQKATTFPHVASVD